MPSTRAAILLALVTAGHGCVFDSSGISGDQLDASATQDTGLQFSDADATPADVFVPTDWFDPNWKHRRPVRVGSIQSNESPEMVTGPLKEFPLLIPLQGDAHLKEHGKESADFRVTDSAGNPLPIDVERFDKGAGDLALWVKLPRVEVSDETLLWLYYGGDASSAGQTSPREVWTADYESVWHLADEPTGETNDVADATSRHPGTSRGGMSSSNRVLGIIGHALLFDGTDDGIDLGSFNVSPADDPDGITLEAWVRFGSSSADQRIISKSTGPSTYQHWWMLDVTTGGGVRTRVKGIYNQVFELQAIPISAAITYHLATTFDGSTVSLFVDGEQVAFLPVTEGALATGQVDVAIGDQPPTAGKRPFNGYIDEVRVSRVARSPAWLRTQFRNQKRDQTLVTVKTPESLE